MKQFNFPLKTLLEVRKQKEILARKDLFEAHLQMKKMLDGLYALLREWKNLIETLKTNQNEKMPAHKLMENFEYFRLLKNKIDLQNKNLKESKISIEFHRKAVIEAMQRRKIIENLKEKKSAEWEAENLNQEKMHIDDLATTRYTHAKLKKKPPALEN